MDRSGINSEFESGTGKLISTLQILYEYSLN